MVVCALLDVPVPFSVWNGGADQYPVSAGNVTRFTEGTQEIRLHPATLQTELLDRADLVRVQNTCIHFQVELQGIAVEMDDAYSLFFIFR